MASGMGTPSEAAGGHSARTGGRRGWHSMGAWEPLRPLKTPSPEFVLVCAGGKGEGPASSSGLRHLTWTLPSRPQVFPGLGRPSHGFFSSLANQDPLPRLEHPRERGARGGNEPI